METPFYRAARDLVDRVGVAQGWIGADDGDLPAEEDPVSDEWVSTAEAAEMKGCTRAAIIRALKENRLVGRKVGKSWIISRASLDRYEPMAVRQESGRRAREVEQERAGSGSEDEASK